VPKGRRSRLAGSALVFLLAACSQKAAAPSTQRAPSSTGATVDAGRAPDAMDVPRACRLHADCGLTRVPEGAVCATLCAPRPVTAAEARHLQAMAAAQRCPEVSCAPPRGLLVPRCEQGRCTVGTLTAN
jgi:hypothetical protein